MSDGRAARAYSSPRRAEQAEQTRSRIVRAAVDLLSEGAGELSMADVAERAGVSVRTVYRSFATKDTLLDGVIGWINDTIQQRAGSSLGSREDHETGTAAVAAVIFDIEPLYRALFATAAGRESHRRTAAMRHESIEHAYAAEMAALDEAAARRLGAVLHLVASSQAALFMKDYWDLSPDDVGRTIQWAIKALADAAGDPEQREGL